MSELRQVRPKTEGWKQKLGPDGKPLLMFAEPKRGKPPIHLVDLTAEERAERLAAAAVIVSGTGMWAEDTPTVCTGMRGLAECEIRLYGPDQDIHSGSFGGAVPNPATAVARLALLAEATERDPRAFGGRDLVDLLTKNVCAAGPESGEATPGCTAKGDFRASSYTEGQALSVLALLRAGVTPPGATVDRLTQLQCKDGGVTSILIRTGEYCDGDPASTGLVALVLHKTGGHEDAVAKAHGKTASDRTAKADTTSKAEKGDKAKSNRDEAKQAKGKKAKPETAVAKAESSKGSKAKPAKTAKQDDKHSKQKSAAGKSTARRA